MLECLRGPLVDLGEVGEHGFRAIQQARAHVVLAQGEQRLHLLRIAEVGPLHQPLVQADRAIHLAAPAEQMAERHLRFERVLVEFGDVQEQLDRLVGLFVEQVIEAAEIGRRQATDLGVAMALAAAAADHPTAQRRDRKQQEQPEPLGNEIHVTGRREGRRSPRCMRARRSCWRIGRITDAASIRPPAIAPTSNAMSSDHAERAEHV